VLVAAVAVAAAAAAPSQSAPARPGDQGLAGLQRLVALDRGVAARAAPSPDAPVVAAVASLTPLTGSQAVLPVIDTAAGPGGPWLRVRLPIRPRLLATGWKIVIHRDERRAAVLDDGRVLASFPVVVGKPSTPTPLGTFFVVEKLRLPPGVTEGPWALATSACSDVVQEFGGGAGQVALHGTVGLSDPLGTFASHGCVRFAPAAITWIAERVVAGTPIVVVR
jgi:lipoprotein-anchoring transpeptidase ErfK/SrfK